MLISTCSGVNSAALFAQLIFSMFNKPQDSISMPPLKSYDFIIVGAGTAGSVLANRLSEVSKWKVLLLEAGGEEPDIASVPSLYYYGLGTQLDWNFLTKPKPGVCAGKPCNYRCGKVLGGSSVINGMTYNRGNKDIYDRWEELGNENWSYEDVLPYFKKSENNLDYKVSKNKTHHSVGGYQYVETFPNKDDNVNIIMKAIGELGYPQMDVNGESQYGYMLEQTFTRHGVRQSVNKCFIKPVRFQRRNLQVITNALVTKVLISPKTKQAYGVEYTLTNKENKSLVQVFATKEVILSAGVIQSPKILQLSGVGPAELLRSLNIPVIKDMPVGYNFMDHVLTGFPFDLALSSVFPNTLQDQIQSLTDSIQNQNGSFYTLGVGVVLLYANSQENEDSEIPDLQFLFTYVDHKNNKSDAFYNAVRIAFFNVKPKSRGTVMIKSKDPFDPPVIEDGYLNEEEDLDVLIDGMMIASKLTKTNALKGVNLYSPEIPQCAHLNNSTKKYFRCVLSQGMVFPGIHGMGTCKMGPESDDDAVVDPQLRVYGIRRLRVVDASIGPEIVNSNTQAPAMMIAEKGADMVKMTWLEDYGTFPYKL